MSRYVLDLKKAKKDDDEDVAERPEKKGTKHEKDADNPNKIRGAVRGGGYLRRVVNGVEKDGSPQYRYIRSQAELKVWEENRRKKKIKGKDEDKETLKEKVAKEHRKSTKHAKPKSKSERKAKKSLIIKARSRE